ncbi:MAG: prolyl oligopeptidase family serine peptidase [Candidatus Kapaibacterium sp.]
MVQAGTHGGEGKDAVAATGLKTGSTGSEADPYLWLEDVDGPRALEFVTTQSKRTLERMRSTQDYAAIYSRSLELNNSTDRIAYPSLYGGFVYNFWQDKQHVRGIWRRTTKALYDAGQPAWETLLDLDEMSRKDNVVWVYKGASALYPSFDRFLVSLSKGGGDAVVVREFDVQAKRFTNLELPESKGSVSYVDANTLLISRDFGKGTLTTSGYPRQVRVWTRGTSVEQATTIYQAEPDDVSVSAYELRDAADPTAPTYTIINRGITFFTSEYRVWQKDAAAATASTNTTLVKLNLPDDCDIVGLQSGPLIVRIKSSWHTAGADVPQGALVSVHMQRLLQGEHVVKIIVAPDAASGISDLALTKNTLIVSMLTNVKHELYIYSFQKATASWEKRKVSAPDFGTINVIAADDLSDTYYYIFTNFLTPTTLYAADAALNTSTALRSLPATFDAGNMEVEQFKARSKDGTLVPYFVVRAKGAGPGPTLLYAYGGFEAPMLPYYSGVMGNAWLAKGGVYVLANIRGGGEFGPEWHRAGLKEKRQNVFDDFHAVAEDLLARGITAPGKLGIMGGSNGGLLVGVAFTQRPDLYNAVVCQVPLLDMKRYNKLLAGASWMGEYGNPDVTEEWEYIGKYSPYHNLRAKVAGQESTQKGSENTSTNTSTSYPEVFFYTSTRDDRVHPGHARKMAAKMMDMGYPALYYENTEGGHGGSSTNEQRAIMDALQYSYLWSKLR